MSLFDDDDENEDDGYWYNPENDFQRKVLENASKVDEHPLLYLADRQQLALEAMETFIEQETLLSAREQMAVNSDVREAIESVERAYHVMPSRVINDE